MTIRSEQLRRAVASLPCQCCRIEGYTQAAHSNLMEHGKGRGLKASDAALMALCCDRPGIVGCHTRLDQYIDITRAQAVELTHKWIASTLIALIESGALKVSK
jgi:hypothetical protein